MSDRTPVFVYARDPISQTGIVAQLRPRPELAVVEDSPDAASVALVVADEVDEETVRVMTALQRNGCPKIVLVATRLDDKGLLAAIQAGACNLLRRSEATPERLTAAVQGAAAGEGAVPPDLLGRLLVGVGRLQRQVLAPRGLSFTGLSEREIRVLRLLADGLEIAEIARQLSYSERTVKSTIHDLLSRHQLKNRSHAVAYAMRQGFI
ncbi:MAG: LuxR C-terminal-related transcriptional regulator [Acidimicrobiia bacterium]